MTNELTYQSIFQGEQIDARLAAVASLREALAAVEQAITAKYTKPASGIPETDLDEAVQSALAKARSAVQDLSSYYTKTEIDALLSAVNSQQYVDVTALPTASADTLGKIYLVGPDANNQYARHYTSYDGSAYSWVAAGTTEINLALYATKAELNQLSQKSADLTYYTKTQNDFPKYKNGYFTINDNLITVNDSYELYVAHLEGVSYAKVHIEGDRATYAGLILWDGPNPNTANRVMSYLLSNGSQDFFFAIPTNAKHISMSSLTGTLQFTLYYKDKPIIPSNTLFIDNLLNSDNNGGRPQSDPSYDNRRVICKSICAFPDAGLKVKFHLPFNIKAYFKITPLASTSSVSETAERWMYDGDTIQMPYYAVAYRVIFAPLRPDDTSEAAKLPASYIRSSIDCGEIYFEYETSDIADVELRNIDKDVRTGALKRNLTSLDDMMNSLFTIGHISDIHSDAPRLLNFMRYIQAKGIDVALNSGDAVLYHTYDDTAFCQRIASQFNIPYLFCIGNHEAQPTGSTTLFADHIQPLVTPFGYLKSSGIPADDCYYYKDFADKKVRIIVVNYYNAGIYDGSLGQLQIDWFIATLSSTPSGYGIIVMNHAAEDKVVAESQYDAFFQKVRWTSGDKSIRNMGGSKPIMDIVDAFIGRTTLSTSFTDNGATVSVNADFSGVDNTIEFIAYVSGHAHEDYIGYYQNSQRKQLCLGITSGNALYGYGGNKALANQEDLPRGGVGVCQDAFNIYAIDRGRKVVKVVRIGADLSFDFRPREYMEIPYAD